MASQNVIVAVEAEDQFSTTFNKFQTELRESHGRVQELERVLKRYKAANDSVINSTKQGTASFRTARSGVAQLGYQVQDIAVQIQGGQNLGIILGQQGSQIASVFGPGGIVAGALISIGALIGTALVPNLFKAKTETDRLKEAQENLNKILSPEGTDSIKAYSDELVRLSDKSARQAVVELAIAIRDSGRVSDAAFSEIQNAIDNVVDPVIGFNNIIAGTSRELDNVKASGMDVGDVLLDISKPIPQLTSIASSVRQLSEEFDLTADQSYNLLVALDQFNSSARQSSDINELRDSLGNIITSGAGANDKFIDLYKTINTNSNAIETTARQYQELTEIQNQVASGSQLIADAKSNETKAINDATKAAEEQAKWWREQLRIQLQETQAAQADEAALAQQAANDAIALETMLAKTFADIEEKKRQDAEATAEWRRDQLRQQLQDAVEFNQKIIALEQNAAGTFGDLAGSVADNLREGTAAQRVFLAAQKGLAVAQALMNMQVAVSEANKLPRPANIIGIAQAMATGLSAVAGIKAVSFEGGGYTGTGIRAGGLDGRGGMPAIVHPNETVIDHTKGQGMGGVTVNFTIQANDTAGFDRLLQSRRGQIISMINQAVNNRGRTSVI